MDSVSWESAAMREVDVRNNGLEDAVLEKLRAAVKSTCNVLAS